MDAAYNHGCALGSDRRIGVVRNAGKALRGTWKAMNEWGDEFEQRHFNGDFIGSIVQAPRIVGAAMTETLLSPGTNVEDSNMSRASSSTAEVASLGYASRTRDEGDNCGGYAVAVPHTPVETQSAVALWEEARRLRDGLQLECEMRRGRAAALHALDEAVCALQSELTEERRLHADANGTSVEARGHSRLAERQLSELRERHQKVICQKEAQDKEIHKAAITIGAAKTAQALWDAPRDNSSAWAREGPELDALRCAKVELAEILGQIDELRFQQRKELGVLQAKLEVAKQENARLKQEHMPPSSSFRESLDRLLTLAATGSEQHAFLEGEWA